MNNNFIFVLMDEYLSEITKVLISEIAVVPPCTIPDDNEFWTKHAMLPRIMCHVNPAEFWCIDKPYAVGLADILHSSIVGNSPLLFRHILSYAKNIERITVTAWHGGTRYEVWVYRKDEADIGRLFMVKGFANRKTLEGFGFELIKSGCDGNYYATHP